VEGWPFPRVFSPSRVHAVNGGESGRVVFSQSLLLAIEGPLVPLQGLVALALLIEYRGHSVNGGECGRVFFSQRLLSSIEGSLIPLQGLVVLVGNASHRLTCGVALARIEQGADWESGVSSPTGIIVKAATLCTLFAFSLLFLLLLNNNHRSKNRTHSRCSYVATNQLLQSPCSSSLLSLSSSPLYFLSVSTTKKSARLTQKP